MYRSFYGLRRRPFELAPDGTLVFLSEAHKEAMATLRYGVIASKGFLLLTGGVGAGKTTLLNMLLGLLKNRVRVCLLNNPTLTRNEFYHFLERKLGLNCKGNKGEFLLQFSDLLDECQKTGEKILLIIDEAQISPIQLLEEVRLLSNLASDKNALSIFLIGQPELQKKLSHAKLLPLRQRIGIRYHLNPLTREDTAQYIAFRLNKAGADYQAIFTTQAIDCIHEASQGNPRLINVICDHALISGFSQDTPQIDRNIIIECLRDIRLQEEERLQVSEASGQPDELPGNLKKDPAPKRRKPLLLVLAIAATALLLYWFVVQNPLPQLQELFHNSF